MLETLRTLVAVVKNPLNYLLIIIMVIICTYSEYFWFQDGCLITNALSSSDVVFYGNTLEGIKTLCPVKVL